MAPPDDICAYQPELPEDWAGESPIEGVTFAGEYCCFRESDGNSDRCIWHSRRRRKRLTASLVELDEDTHYDNHPSAREDDSHLSSRSRILSAERIDDAYLGNARVTNLDLEGVYFYNSRFDHAQFRDVQIELAKFSHCLLDNAKFNDCLIGATFEQTSICLAEFKKSEFTGAKLVAVALIGVRFYNCDLKASTFESPEFSRGVLFSDCSIDHSTTFDDIRIQNTGADGYEARTKLYGQLADMCLSSREVSKYIKYKERERNAEGSRQWLDLKSSDQYRRGFISSLVNFLSHEYSRVTMGYGYNIGRVLVSMGIVLVLSGLFYAGVECTSGDIVGISYGCTTSEGLLRTVLDSMYFSITTFTSTGYGDISPLGVARFVAGWQMLAGLILGAQFVYVLARQTSL